MLELTKSVIEDRLIEVFKKNYWEYYYRVYRTIENKQLSYDLKDPEKCIWLLELEGKKYNSAIILLNDNCLIWEFLINMEDEFLNKAIVYIVEGWKLTCYIKKSS